MKSAMKAASSVSTWARGIGFALMLAATGTAWAHIVHAAISLTLRRQRLIYVSALYLVKINVASQKACQNLQLPVIGPAGAVFP